jgi:hypothetical protein
MAARIARRIGIDADKPKLADLDAGFLKRLAPARFLHPLADLDKSSWKSVGAGKGRMTAADEQHAASRIEDHAIRGERRRLRQCHRQARVEIAPCEA